MFVLFFDTFSWMLLPKWVGLFLPREGWELARPSHGWPVDPSFGAGGRPFLQEVGLPSRRWPFHLRAWGLALPLGGLGVDPSSGLELPLPSRGWIGPSFSG